MAITNTWSVVQMDCYPEVDGATNVVFTVHWTLTGVDGDYIGSVYGSQPIMLDQDSSFTPYKNLTEAQVIGWVQEALGAEQVENFEANVAGQIAAQINPPVTTPPLPWGDA